MLWHFFTKFENFSNSDPAADIYELSPRHSDRQEFEKIVRAEISQRMEVMRSEGDTDEWRTTGDQQEQKQLQLPRITSKFGNEILRSENIYGINLFQVIFFRKIFLITHLNFHH